MFAYTVMQLIFLAPQIVVRACVYANAYLTMHYCLSPSIKTFTYANKVSFFQRKIIAILSMKESDY